MAEAPKEKFNVNVFRSGVEFPADIADEIKEDEEKVKELAKFLKEQGIKGLIKDMKSITGTIPCDSESLEKLFHSHGVNMRYLGMVYKELKTVPKKKEGGAQAKEELQDLQNNGDYKHL